MSDWHHHSFVVLVVVHEELNAETLAKALWMIISQLQTAHAMRQRLVDIRC